MPLYTTLASLSQTAASNVADGSVDAPSTIDQQTNLLASFIAQLRDGNGFATGLANVGQCRLTKSGSNLLLSPYGGNGLTINGVVYKIPSAGVTLAPTSLTPSTLYYIYAYMSSGTMTLEASTTGHSTDTTTGVEIKTGDATRTLVGMARPIAGPAWQDAANQRFVVSWFNRIPLSLTNAFTGNQTTAATSPAEVSTSIRCEFVCWASSVQGAINGWVSNNTAGFGGFTQISANGAVNDSATFWVSVTSNAIGPACCSGNFTYSEGYGYLTLLGNTGGSGTITYPGAPTPNGTGRVSIYGSLQG